MKRTAVTLSLLLLVVLISSCAALKSRPSEQVVAERAQAYVSALVNKQYAQAYPYTSPGYRSGVSQHTFVQQWRNRLVKWVAGEVEKVECAEQICTATIMISYAAKIPSHYVGDFKSKRRIRLKWFQSDDKLWYYSPTR